MNRVVCMLLLVAVSVTWAQTQGNSESPKVEPSRRVVYGEKQGTALTMEVFRPQKANGAAILFINSGGFMSPIFERENSADPASRFLFLSGAGEKIDLGMTFGFKELLFAGFTVFDVRHGSAPQFKLDEIVADCERAVRFVRENAADFRIDAHRIGVWGMSAGGYLAGYLATLSGPGDGKANAAVAYFPAGYDFVAEIAQYPMLGEQLPALNLPDSLLSALSLKGRISSDDAPILILYGDEDNGFITQPSEAVYAGLLAAGVPTKRVAYAGTGHLFRDSQGKFTEAAAHQAMEELIAWFKMYLPGGQE